MVDKGGKGDWELGQTSKEKGRDVMFVDDTVRSSVMVIIIVIIGCGVIVGCGGSGGGGCLGPNRIFQGR